MLVQVSKVLRGSPQRLLRAEARLFTGRTQFPRPANSGDATKALSDFCLHEIQQRATSTEFDNDIQHSWLVNQTDTTAHLSAAKTV